MPTSMTRYYLLDVFTETPLAGNPLAVFPDARGMDGEHMQAIANELNLSETVFVGERHADNEFSMRIFTPDTELPFAGHPTVGTAHLLVAQGLVDSTRPLTLRVPAGSMEVTFDGQVVRFTAPQPVSLGASSLGRAAAAGLLGLEASAIVGDPVQASCGLACHLVPLDSGDSLSRVVPDSGLWAQHLTPSGVENLCLFVEEGRALSTRLFFRANGMREDPATGSASAALAGYLACRDKQSAQEWRLRQGVDMGRPSDIEARARRDEGGQTWVEIGGQAVLVGEGALYPQG